MSDFNHTIQLAQSELDGLKRLLTAAQVGVPRPVPKPVGNAPVGRVPYNKQKYKKAAPGKHSFENREVF